MAVDNIIPDGLLRRRGPSFSDDGVRRVSTIGLRNPLPINVDIIIIKSLCDRWTRIARIIREFVWSQLYQNWLLRIIMRCHLEFWQSSLSFVFRLRRDCTTCIFLVGIIDNDRKNFIGQESRPVMFYDVLFLFTPALSDSQQQYGPLRSFPHTRAQENFLVTYVVLVAYNVQKLVTPKPNKN